MKVQYTNTFDGTECFAVSSNQPTSNTQGQRAFFGAGFSDGMLRIWDFNELTNNQEGTTLDKPKYEIENAFNLGPVDVKFDASGKYVAASSLDNSVKIFSL